MKEKNLFDIKTYIDGNKLEKMAKFICDESKTKIEKMPNFVQLIFSIF